LETSAGGAAATPFKSHHNALDIDVFFENILWENFGRKKLMVAQLMRKLLRLEDNLENEGIWIWNICKITRKWNFIGLMLISRTE
jgi:lysyl-tRNA synthetase class II